MSRKQKSKIEDAVIVDSTEETNPFKEEPQIPEKNYRDFEFGDLHIVCGRCGEVSSLEKGIQGGIQLVLPATDKHELKMECGKCGNFMRLYFTENLTKKKEQEHEPESENKEKESVQGVPEDSK